MNRYLTHSIAKTIIRCIENNGTDAKLAKLMEVLAEELKDPFSSSIDEFLIDKQKKESGEDKKDSEEEESSEPSQEQESNDEHPQEQSIDELKDEAVEYKEPKEQEHPKDSAVDEMKKEAIDYEKPVEQNAPQEKASDKLVDEVKDANVDNKEEIESDESNESAVESVESDKEEEDEDTETKDKNETQIESSLKRLGAEIFKRGYSHLANRFIMASSEGILTVLNNLLMKEFLIRDILENYSYLFISLGICAERHKPKESILYLQKQIIALGGKPTPQRLAIPAINPASEEGILALVKEHEANLISDYLAAIKTIEAEDKYLTLKIMFTKIVRNKSQLRNEV